MKRLLILFALAGLSTATACGSDSGGSSADDDDDDDDEDDDNDDSTGSKKDAGKNSGKDAGGKDAGVVSRGTQIENLGVECESVDECEGDGTVDCLKDFFGAVTFPGGYCTAGCATDDECGPEGGCPFAAILANPLAASFGAGLEASCMKTCDGEDPDSCGRDGYTCNKLSDLFAGIPGVGGFVGPLLGAAASQSFCMPPISLEFPDAGLPSTPAADAGSAGKDAGGISGGLDAGKDAGAGDAGRLDAGRDTGR